MDEIIIDEKKYVSSKRAAKMTGYAKDYIGQLCREGRVPARLVGRSWYVLESAIQDHRFGAQKPEEETKKDLKEEEVHLKLQSTWESPRYEASTAEILPSINRLRNTDYKAPFGEPQKTTEEHQLEVQEKETLPEPLHTVSAIPEESSEETPINPEHSIINNGEVMVPVHTLYELPPKDLLPKSLDNRISKKEDNPTPVRKGRVDSTYAGRGLWVVTLAVALLKVFAVLLAVASVLLAIAGTGYLDKILASHNRATPVTGVGTYIK